MSIVPNWITMRERWSGLGTVDNDGIKTWDTSLLNLGLDTADIEIECVGTLVLYTVTAPEAADYCLLAPHPWMGITQTSTTEASLQITAAGALQIGESALGRRRMFRNMWLYVRRISDGAICARDLSLADSLSTGQSTTL